MIFIRQQINTNSKCFWSEFFVEMIEKNEVIIKHQTFLFKSHNQQCKKLKSFLEHNKVSIVCCCESLE